MDGLYCSLLWAVYKIYFLVGIPIINEKSFNSNLNSYDFIQKHIVKIAHNMGISLSFNDMPEKNKKTDTFTA